MRVRHRIPSIFNLSMVDVLCCALGCVILLWLINLREAKNNQEDSAEKLAQTSTLLDQAKGDRDSAYSQLVDSRSRADVLEKDKTGLLLTSADLDQKLKAAGQQLLALQGEVQERGKRIATLGSQAADLNRKLEASTRQAQDLNQKLDASNRRSGDLGQKLDASTRRADALQAQAGLVPGLRMELQTTRDKLAAEETRLKDLLKAMTAANKDLEALRTARAGLERDLESKDKELTQARPYKDKWTAGEDKLRGLEKLLAERDKELSAARQDLAGLRQEKTKWQAEVQRARAAVENRFAGIALTGKRVLFLVDMSGSMELVDEKTAAPNKWAEVNATVVKLMQSLPELEKFQVVVFAEKAGFLLGGDGQWFDFDPRASTERVQQALGQLKPRGGTNMYAALEAAFRYRDKGLDTIYLLSDGLPNLGEGVPYEVARQMKEVDLSEKLAKHIRKTLKDDWNSNKKAQPPVRINTIGFFYESPDVGAFLWALARENDGSFVGMSKP